MKIIYWIAIAFALFYSAAYWWYRYTKAAANLSTTWPLLVVVGVAYVVYWQRDRVDASDAHKDMRGKQPDSSDE